MFQARWWRAARAMCYARAGFGVKELMVFGIDYFFSS
jgi:hypothetical protein